MSAISAAVKNDDTVYPCAPVEAIPLHHAGDIVVRLCEGERVSSRGRVRYMRLYVILHRAGGEMWTHAYRTEHDPKEAGVPIHLLDVRKGNRLAAVSRRLWARWVGGDFGAAPVSDHIRDRENLSPPLGA